MEAKATIGQAGCQEEKAFPEHSNGAFWPRTAAVRVDSVENMLLPESVTGETRSNAELLLPEITAPAPVENPAPEAITVYDNPFMRAVARLIYAEASRYDFR